MAFYVEHFMEVRDVLIIQPPYTSRHWVHSLRIPWASFEWVHLAFKLRLTTKLTSQIGSINYAIFERSRKGALHLSLSHLLWDSWVVPLFVQGATNLSTFFKYLDQYHRCLALYPEEDLKFWSHTVWPHPRPDSTHRNTSFLPVFYSARGTKRQTDSNIASDSRLVRTQRTIPPSQQHQCQCHTRSLNNR